MSNFYKNEALALESMHGFDGNDLMLAGNSKADILATNPNLVNARVSDPVILSLNNTTAAAITNVTMFNATAGIGSFNNGVNAGVVATYGYAGISYAQFLQWMIARSFHVGAWQAITTTDAQALQTFNVSTTDMFGNSIGKAIVPRIDPTWNKTGNVYQKDTFSINNTTVITLASLGAGLTVTYYFYPDLMESAGGQWVSKDIQSAIRPLAITSK